MKFHAAYDIVDTQGKKTPFPEFSGSCRRAALRKISAVYRGVDKIWDLSIVPTPRKEVVQWAV